MQKLQCINDIITMLLRFKIRNYRSIKDQIVLDLQATSDSTLKKQSVFEIGKIALLKSAAIYGPNASGKSNILLAFLVFRNMILESQVRSNLPVELPNEFFKLSSTTTNKPSYFEIDFLLDSEIYNYGFQISKKAIHSEWLRKEKGNITLFKREQGKIDSNKNYFKEAASALKKQAQNLENVLFLTILAANGGEISKKIVKFIQNTNYISGAQRGDTLNFSFGQFMNNPHMAEKMKDFILKSDFGVIDIKASEKMILAKEARNIPDKFKELLFKEDSKIAERSLAFIYQKYNAKGESIGEEPLDFFTETSEGSQQVFALSAPILDTLEHGKVLFIDEIDASLHPLFCQRLITIFNSKEANPKNAQLVFTTHDISLLKEEFLRRDQIYFTDKDNYGGTELFSLADISERKGVDFAKRYMEGRYNALPYLSDFEDLKFYK